MEATAMSIVGRVSRKRVAAGSKSDRVAVVLHSRDGTDYVLRRRGGNPFRDETLENLIGKTIRGTGLLTGPSFILEDWAELSTVK